MFFSNANLFLKFYVSHLLAGSAKWDEFERPARGCTPTDSSGMGRHAAARHGAHAIHQSMAMTLGWHDDTE